MRAAKRRLKTGGTPRRGTHGESASKGPWPRLQRQRPMSLMARYLSDPGDATQRGRGTLAAKPKASTERGMVSALWIIGELG
jgi:hypothetical protein